MQPWKVIVVRSPERKRALADIYGPEWHTYTGFSRRRAEKAGMAGDELAAMERTLAAGDYLADHLADAPVLLLFIADPAKMAITDKNLDRISMVGGGSVCARCRTPCSPAGPRAWGCTLTTLHCIREPEVKAALDIPETGPPSR